MTTHGKLTRSLLGCLVTMRTASGATFHGRIVADEHGALVLRTPSGACRAVAPGATLRSREYTLPR